MTVIGMYIYVIKSQSVTTYESMNLFLFVAKIIMVFLGWIFIILSLQILMRKGTNQQLRYLALRR